MQDKSSSSYKKTNFLGLALTCSIYIVVALISVAMFGENINPDIL